MDRFPFRPWVLPFGQEYALFFRVCFKRNLSTTGNMTDRRAGPFIFYFIRVAARPLLTFLEVTSHRFWSAHIEVIVWAGSLSGIAFFLLKLTGMLRIDEDR